MLLSEKKDKREEIINQFLPYIKYTAYRLSWKLPTHVTVDDLISVGLMGLIDAVERFEPGRVKLKTYAELRIKGAMIDELRSTGWIPRSMRGKIREINDARTKLEKKLGRMPDDAEVAKLLNMSLDKYYKILRYSTYSDQIRLEDLKVLKYADNKLDLIECIADPDAKTPLKIIEDKNEKKRLASLIDSLPENEKMVLALYYYEELTMKEIGRMLDLTESRVCQIHSQAINSLKNRIKQSCNSETVKV